MEDRETGIERMAVDYFFIQEVRVHFCREFSLNFLLERVNFQNHCATLSLLLPWRKRKVLLWRRSRIAQKVWFA